MIRELALKIKRKKLKGVRSTELALQWHDHLCTKNKTTCAGRKKLTTKLKKEKNRVK